MHGHVQLAVVDVQVGRAVKISASRVRASSWENFSALILGDPYAVAFSSWAWSSSASMKVSWLRRVECWLMYRRPTCTRRAARPGPRRRA